jgi:uncharacterized spore protein YtfJ
MASVPRFDADRLATAANEIFTVRRVFGEAYERDGVTVIPVAKVWAATGMGQGDGEGGGELPHGAHVRGWWRDAQRAWGDEGSSGELASDEGASDQPSAQGSVDPSTGAPGGYGGGHGGGGGYGVRVKPVGVYVVDAGGAHWRPAVDLNRIVLGGQLVAATAIATLAAALAVKSVANAVSSAVQAFADR